MKTKFYPTITAISGQQYKKIKEADNLNLKKLCVFFSPLNSEERKKFYRELEKSNIEEIIFAHIRGDFTKDEIYYLKKRFKTKLFNLHSTNHHPILYKLEDLKKEIYIENTVCEFSEDEIENYAGLCLDISHLESDRLTKDKRYKYFKKILKEVDCGCGHASAIKKEKTHCPVVGNQRYDEHIFNKMGDFDYLLRYKNILPKTIALEVENTLEEQLKAIKYINKLLKI